MDFIEPCFGIDHNLSLICQMTSEDIKHQLIIILKFCEGEWCRGLKRLVVELGSHTMSKRQSIISLWIIVT